MTWAQKDDGSWSDPRLCALSDRAYRLYDNCWTYSADKLTDGRITPDEVVRVAAMFGLTSPKDLAKAIEELLTWKVWTQNSPTYVMDGWLAQNRSKKKVLRSRELNAQKQARWRRKMAPTEDEK